jgi:hypothetical protein
MKKLRVVLSVGVLLGVTASCAAQASRPLGRVVEPIQNAVRVKFTPVLTPDAERARQLTMAMRIKNVSDGSVLIGRCSLQAVDAHNRPLFTIKNVRRFAGWRVTTVLRSGDVFTTQPSPAGEGVAPGKVSIEELQAIERYRNVECKVYRWVGPLPEPDSDQD